MTCQCETRTSALIYNREGIAYAFLDPAGEGEATTPAAITADTGVLARVHYEDLEGRREVALPVAWVVECAPLFLSKDALAGEMLARDQAPSLDVARRKLDHLPGSW